MPISSTTTNYTQRKKDLHVFQNVNPRGTAVTKLEFGKISNFCAGVQKLVQRYAIALLTNQGSQESTESFGTNLLSKLYSRNLHLNKADVFPLFNQASNKVHKEFRRYQSDNPGMPEDEQLRSAKLLGVTITNDGVGLDILITPVSNTPVQFVIPLPKTS